MLPGVFQKLVSPGLPGLLVATRLLAVISGKSYWVSLNYTSVVVYKEFPLDKGI